WDEKLTLEFSDANPAVSSIEIVPEKTPETVYLIGDSTVTDQMMEPWAAWGQIFPRWFKPPILIANYAESGETASGFITELRWSKLLSEIHRGDYVLMQFGINDQRVPIEQFEKALQQFIADSRDHGAIPVLVTSQNLRRLDEQGHAVQTLGEYPAAMREIAANSNVPLIDLNAMSMKLYEALGPKKLPTMFVDDTHQNGYGAYQLAKCVIQGLVDAKIPFTENLIDWKPFDPSRPDALEDFHLPPDPQLDPARPGGPGAPLGKGPMAGDRPAQPKPAK
ncbi:MAG TPA: rhamnogalacturonan acetylesterase, partial [Opitutaceae bacterium]|nr:rhamnogalacturonan acetylesterase [Opitutaceae bacterium]